MGWKLVINIWLSATRFEVFKMSTETKKDTCGKQKGKNGKQKRKKGDPGDEGDEREMILGEEHWNRWQERNKTPFVSF